MERSQKVKQKLEEQKSVSRDGQFHSKTMKTRAVQEDNISGKITDIHVNNTFVYIGNKKTISLASSFCSSIFKSRNEIHETIADSNDHLLKNSYAIRYEPEVNIEIKLESDKIGYISFSHLSDRAIKGFDFVEMLFNLCNGSFSNIENQEINVIYRPTSNTGGEFILINEKSEIKSKRRFFDNKVNKDTNYEVIDSWLSYLQSYESPQGWIETEIKDIYTDGDKISLLVETPTNETLFNFEFTQNKNSKFWNLVEDVGHGDPLNLKGESMYVAPYYKKFSCDDFEYLTTDIELEWVISNTNPSTQNPSTQDEETYFDKIKSKLNI